MNVLLLHPGEMGSSVGAALLANGHDVAWATAGRSAATRQRAERCGLRSFATVAEGVRFAQLVISVCPPEAAVAVAKEVRQEDFDGIYLDGNAVAPASAAQIAAIYGDRFVDGGIIGPPAWRAGAMRFYLSGAGAEPVAALFRGSLVDARAIAAGAGAASALKMCYAAFTKGSSALLLAVRALAERHGLGAELLAEWDVSQPGLGARSERTARSTSPKAWRFEGEMREIADTFAAAELPDGFHRAAAEIYARMADLKEAEGADLDAVLASILRR